MRGSARLLLPLLVALISGCAHRPTRPPTGLKAEDFSKEQAHRRQSLIAYTARLRLRYQSRDEGVSGKGGLLTRSGSLRLELRDPLGRLQYQVTVDGKRFVAYYPTQKRAYTDDKAGLEYMKRFLGFPFSFSDLENLLIGVIPKSWGLSQFSHWEWDAKKGLYRGSARSGEAKIGVDVDPDTAAARRITWDSPIDTLEIDYEDFAPVLGVSTRLAHSVTVKLKRVASGIEADWERVAQAPTVQDAQAFRPQLPAGIQETRLP